MSAYDALIASRGAALGSAEPADLDAAAARVRRRQYGTIVVVGGGCYGSYYVRQLARAWSAGALRWRRLVVIDRDGGCLVGRAIEESATGAPPIELARAEWGAFLDQYLGDAAASPDSCADDAVVPSPLMPHLVVEWLERRARARWPSRSVSRAPLARAPDVPWQRAGADHSHFVSFAEWVCPINCIEPRLCPVIRGPRTWSMPRAVRDYVSAERERGVPLAGPVLLHCAHRAYGVGMFDTGDVIAADAFVGREAATAPADVLVGTVSHCHGALGRLTVGA